MTMIENAVVIPQGFTGRDPILVSRSAVRSFDTTGDGVTLFVVGGGEIHLKPEGELTQKRVAELCVLLFGPERAEVSMALSPLTGSSRRWVNPGAICSIELLSMANESKKLRVSLVEGRPLETPHTEFATYQRVVETVYGREAARLLKPWVQPAPPAGVLEMAKTLIARRTQREGADAAERERSEKAAAAKAVVSRYVKAT